MYSGGAGLGETLLIQALINNVEKSGAVAVYVPEDPADGESMVSPNLCVVRTEENASQEAHLNAVKTAVTVAKNLRNLGHDVLLVIERSFGILQAEIDVAELLRRTTSAVRYRPHLEEAMRSMQVRTGSITSVQAINTPVDELTDQESTTFAHLDARVVLSRSLSELGIYPAVDPLGSDSRLLAPNVIDLDHSNTATDVRNLLSQYKPGQDVIAVLCMDEPSAEDQLMVSRALKIRHFLSQPLDSIDELTKVVSVKNTIAGFKGILNGKYDHLPEQAFNNVGGIEEVIEKAKTLIIQPR